MIDVFHTICDRHLSSEEQGEWIGEVRGILKEAPLVRPTARGGHPMKVRISGAGSFGWTAEGGAYRYDKSQRNGKPWPAIPSRWSDLASEVAGKENWDSAVINWYEEGASLGWHQDLEERDHSKPIVTVSLGDSCSWAVRASKDDPITRARLGSGWVTILSEGTRMYFHTVERIIAEPLLSPLKTRGRISVTLRVAG